MRKVVITGLGIWCSLGRTLKSLDENVRKGCCGQRIVKRLDLSNPFYRTAKGAVLVEEQRMEEFLDETCLVDLGITVSLDAIQDARINFDKIDKTRLGISLGTSHGGNIAYTKFIRGRLGLPGGRIDHRLTLSITPSILGKIASYFGVLGPTVTISTACSSGTNSVGRAAEIIKLGQADVMLAGGVDLFTELSFSGFNVLGLLSKGVCRPLDRDRDGMMLGDGAAILVLENYEHAKMRGVKPYVEIIGYAIVNEAYHATAPSPDGSGPARVIQEALNAAKVSPHEVDYINLHGTGTIANDLAELRAIEKVFGSHAKKIMISSSKSMVGHCLGAAGSVELLITALGVSIGFVPPSINLINPIPGFEDWNYVRDVARIAEIQVAISNSFGFAGSLSSIVIKRI